MIAAGGGAILNAANTQARAAGGTIICLKATPDVIAGVLPVGMAGRFWPAPIPRGGLQVGRRASPNCWPCVQRHTRRFHTVWTPPASPLLRPPSV